MKKRTQYVLLGLLRETAMNGYEIKKAIDLRMSTFWQESYGQIYPELKALTEAGMLTCQPDETPSSKRDSFRYSITENGINELNHWMAQSCEPDSIRSERMLRYFLATDDNKEEILTNLREDLTECEEKIKLFHLFETQIEETMTLHSNHKYLIEIIRLAIRQNEDRGDWARNYIKKLERSLIL